MIRYILEVWGGSHYYKIWEGRKQYAETMFNKPYYRKHTRRLVRITTEVVKTGKKSES